jgi:hypothetical protein
MDRPPDVRYGITSLRNMKPKTKGPPMAKKSVFCIATSISQADRIVDRLREANFSNNDISALFSDKESTREFAHEKNTKAPEGAITGVGTGGVIGGALGWLAGIGSLAIPGIGPSSRPAPSSRRSAARPLAAPWAASRAP